MHEIELSCETHRRRQLTRSEETVRECLLARFRRSLECCRFSVTRCVPAAAGATCEFSSSSPTPTHSGSAVTSLSSSGIIAPEMRAAIADDALDAVLDALRKRHAKAAEQLSKYNKVHDGRAAHGTASTAWKVLLQHECEEREDIEFVEDSRRAKACRAFQIDATSKVGGLICAEHRGRLSVSAAETEARASLLCEYAHFVAASAELTFRGPRPGVQSGPTTTPVDELPSDRLLVKALENLQFSAREKLQRHENFERCSILAELRLITSGGSTAGHRVEGNHKAGMVPTADRVAFLKRLACARGWIEREHAALAEGVGEEEREARTRLTYHYHHVVRFQLSLPCSVGQR